MVIKSQFRMATLCWHDCFLVLDETKERLQRKFDEVLIDTVIDSSIFFSVSVIGLSCCVFFPRFPFVFKTQVFGLAYAHLDSPRLMLWSNPTAQLREAQFEVGAKLRMELPLRS